MSERRVKGLDVPPKLDFLVDAQAFHRKHPKTFKIPDEQQIAALRVGHHAKVIVNNRERIWVCITRVDEAGFAGTLANCPLTFDGTFGDDVCFEAKNIIAVAPPIITS